MYKAKTCCKCKAEYPATTEYFYANKTIKSGLSRQCKKCSNQASRVYHSQHPEKCKENTRNSLLKRLYGISIADYNKMFAKQNGCCAICGRHQTELKQRLAIDHDHKTKEIRGLLCNSCNAVLGSVFENVTILNVAIHYLSKEVTHV